MKKEILFKDRLHLKEPIQSLKTQGPVKVGLDDCCIPVLKMKPLKGVNGLNVSESEDSIVINHSLKTLEDLLAGENIELESSEDEPGKIVIKSTGLGIPIEELVKQIQPLLTDNDTIFDPSDILNRLTELENKPDSDTLYDDTEVISRLSALENKADKDTIYDDSELRDKITALEGRVDSDTIYNDTELRNRIETLENKQDNDTIYNDSELRSRIEILEAKPDKDTIYDDTSLVTRITELENKPEYNDTEIRNILDTKISLNDLQDDLVIKSQEVLDNSLKVVLTYTNTKGQSKDLEINQPLPQYQLPEHLTNLTPEQIEKLLKLIENIGIWDDEQPRIFNDNFTNEFA